MAAFLSVSPMRFTVIGPFGIGSCVAGPAPVGLIHIAVIFTYTAVTPSTGASIRETLSDELVLPPPPPPPPQPLKELAAARTVSGRMCKRFMIRAPLVPAGPLSSEAEHGRAA